MRILRWGGLSLLVVCLVALTNGFAADDKKPADKKLDETVIDQKALDAAVRQTLYVAINYGAQAYNQGYSEECYRTFHSALLTAEHALSHHPKIQKYIKDGLADAEKMKSFDDRAFKLRDVLDKVRDDLRGGVPAAPVVPVVPVEKKTKTIWDRLGGEQGVEKIVDEFVTTAAKDPKVNFDRGGKYKLDAAAVAKLKNALVAQLSSITGGPLKYAGDMKKIHKGMQITDEEFDAATRHLTKALRDNKASASDITAIMSVVGGMRNDIVEPKQPEPPKETSAWDRLGGEKGVAKIVDDFVATASKDPKVNVDRGGTVKLDQEAVARIKKALVSQISTATGGPLKYGVDMKTVHKGMQITDAEFDAHNKHLKDALVKNNVKEADIKLVMDFFEKTRKDLVEAKKPDDKPKGLEVHGKVTVDGKALASGKISFIGMDGKPISGDIKDGNYTLSGMKPGSYKITIEGDKINERYKLAETSPLRHKIADEEKSALDWDLKP